jgi:hypothetical protein
MTGTLSSAIQGDFLERDITSSTCLEKKTSALIPDIVVVTTVRALYDAECKNSEVLSLAGKDRPNPPR